MRDDVRGLHMWCGHNCKTLYQFVVLPFCHVFAMSPFCHDWRGWTGIVVGLLDGLGNARGAAQLELELHVNGGGICGKRM